MVNNEQFSDVAFLVEGRTVHAHKFILFARSEYFRRMFTSAFRESTDSTIPIGNVRHEVFLCVLAFLYTGKPREIDPQMAVEVLGVANLYSVEPLKRICADLIMRSVCVQNVASILQAADTYQVLHLRQHCVNFAVEHFAEVVRTEGFRELICEHTRPLVCLVLEEAAARVPSSSEVARAPAAGGVPGPL